jgi:hypothetical protein
MSPREHQLFKQYPLNGTATVATGSVPTPYHIYDGYGAFIGGTADLAAVQQLLQPEQVTPIQITDGRALLGVWICDFSDASLGPHHELQCSIFVARQPVAPIAPQPVSLLAAMLTRPEIQMLCHGLWNNVPTVVAYNRDVLSLNARLTTSTIAKDARQLTFQFSDPVTSAPIAMGRLSRPQQPSWRASLALMAQLGLGQTLRISRQPCVPMAIVNPIGVRLPCNAVAQALAKNATNNLRYFDPATDLITFGDSPYRALHFEPQIVQHMDGFKFVYLQPE